MPHERMARNLNQSLFAIIVGTAFSALLLALFSIDALILAIFEIPLAFLVALITVTECIYSYREEVSLQTTYNMLKSLLKSLLYSIPIVGFYSAILLILYNTVPAFENGLVPLFNQLQGLNEIAAIILLMFIPVFLMLFATPILLYIYGKVHILLWKPKEKKLEEKELRTEAKEKEIEKKVFQITDQLDHYALQLQQYFLELQGIAPLIDSVKSHDDYKTLHTRLSMMNDYIETLEIEEDKENKLLLEEEDVKRKLNEVEIQKKTIIDVVQQNLKKLKKDKGKFEKEEEEVYYDEKEKKKAEEPPEELPKEEEEPPKEEEPPEELPKVEEELPEEPPEEEEPKDEIITPVEEEVTQETEIPEEPETLPEEKNE